MNVLLQGGPADNVRVENHDAYTDVIIVPIMTQPAPYQVNPDEPIPPLHTVPPRVLSTLKKARYERVPNLELSRFA